MKQFDELTNKEIDSLTNEELNEYLEDAINYRDMCSRDCDKWSGYYGDDECRMDDDYANLNNAQNLVDDINNVFRKRSRVKSIKEMYESEYQDLLEHFGLNESQVMEFYAKLNRKQWEYNEVVDEIIDGANSNLKEMEELLKELREKYLARILYETQIEDEIEAEIADYEDAFNNSNQNYIGCFNSDIINDEEDLPLLHNFIINDLIHEDLNHFYNDNNIHERDILNRVKNQKILSDYVTKSEIIKIIEELEEEYLLESDEDEILNDIDENLNLDELECSSTIRRYIIDNHITEEEY